MKTPFTAEQFIENIRNYNLEVFPMQIVFYIIAAFTIYHVMKPNSKSGKIISVVLALLWLWMGIEYHIVFFTTINKAAYLFGALFIIQNVLFLVLGVIQNRLSFRFKNDIFGITGEIFLLFALIIYPILGLSFGHIYPNLPTFGLPCPTTIFTFGILLLSDKKCPAILLVIPFLWSAIGFTAAFNFGIYEDAGLLISGVIGTIMLLKKNRMMKTKDFKEFSDKGHRISR